MARADNKYKNLLEFEKPLIEVFKKIEALEKTKDIDTTEEIKMLKKRIQTLRKDVFSKLTPIQIVKVARHMQRPTTLDYINNIFTDWIELHGDRNFSDDPAMVCGIAKLDGKPVVIVGQQKGKNTKEYLKRNFGMANPEGYRKALRIMRIADRYKRPIISFINTPGAYPGIGAEERGQAEAIAKNLREMTELTVPFISIITGEGGSGGALGIGMGNRVLIQEFAVYSVISPEGCASILFRDAKRAPEAALAMKITAKDLLELKVVDDIIKEPIGGAHNNIPEAAKHVKSAIIKHLKPLTGLSPREMIADRYRKYRAMGVFLENGEAKK